MKTTINPYLTFDGNCEAAFNFYKSVFGGDFAYIGRYKDMPPQDGFETPEGFGDKIMHVSLPIGGDTILMGADFCGDGSCQFTVGNNISISINTDSKESADRLFKGLSEGGTPFMPMATTFWGAYFGMLVDKYGVNWMVSFEVQQ